MFRIIRSFWVIRFLRSIRALWSIRFLRSIRVLWSIRVLRAFRALPTEERVKAMTGRDYLWCALHLLLDQEEEAARLCPACRAEAEEARCPVCGRAVGEVTRGENPGFDLERFERLKKGGVL